MIPASGAFGISNVNTEVGRSSSANLSLNDPVTRLLTTSPTLFTGGASLAMSSLRGRTGSAIAALMQTQTNGVGAISDDALTGGGVLPPPLGTIAGGTIGVSEILSGRRIAPGSGHPLSTVVRMNCPTPYERFWGMGVWHGANYLGAFRMADRTEEIDQYAANQWIGVAWALSQFGPDLRPYLGQTLTFVFVN